MEKEKTKYGSKVEVEDEEIEVDTEETPTDGGGGIGDALGGLFQKYMNKYKSNLGQ